MQELSLPILRRVPRAVYGARAAQTQTWDLAVHSALCAWDVSPSALWASSAPTVTTKCLNTSSDLMISDLVKATGFLFSSRLKTFFLCFPADCPYSRSPPKCIPDVPGGGQAAFYPSLAVPPWVWVILLHCKVIAFSLMSSCHNVFMLRHLTPCSKNIFYFSPQTSFSDFHTAGFFSRSSTQ